MLLLVQLMLQKAPSGGIFWAVFHLPFSCFLTKLHIFLTLFYKNTIDNSQIHLEICFFCSLSPHYHLKRIFLMMELWKIFFCDRPEWWIGRKTFWCSFSVPQFFRSPSASRRDNGKTLGQKKTYDDKIFLSKHTPLCDVTPVAKDHIFSLVSAFAKVQEEGVNGIVVRTKRWSVETREVWPRHCCSVNNKRHHWW